MSDIQDLKFIKDSEKALDALFDKYAEAEPSDKWVLKPAIKAASEELLTARLALFKDGVLTTRDDINKLKEIRQEIDNAADTQALIMSALKLAAFLGVFA
ncbi:hypothetical protein [Photobacterium lipolyticum]|uniref:Uncharacterized protein n=1 Tax=Photobacterium lipolyticum TaxID=266810 RepID=A0A2T3N067_9GAMM|nr:hypothetical protein [Photobacterium lipolyticum]PSW05652.1 hypothetical protein C9I89_07840 [Photobacterium lipolyticum]